MAIITEGANSMGKDTALKFAAHGTQAIVIADIQDEKAQNAAMSHCPSLSDLACHHLVVIWDFGMVLWI